MAVISSTPTSELSDLDLIKESLHLRGPYGEIPDWWTDSERERVSDRSVALRRELSTRKLGLPSQQSIGRSAGSSLTPEELEIWHELVAGWDGVSPAPKGDDARLDLQEG